MNEEDTGKDSHELEKIRMKKIKAMVDAQKRIEANQKKVLSIYDKIDFVLKVVLKPEAYSRLIQLKTNEPEIYQKILNELVSPDVFQNIDYLITIIQRRGGVPRRIPLDVIIYLERKAKGIKGKIQVKRGDEMMDLGSYLTK